MNAESRRKIEMGTRALEFSRAHPDADAGYAMAAAKLEQLVARANEAAAAQRSGVVDVRAASARKAELRRTMLAVHIAHLAQVGREAAREDHELGKTFRFKPQAGTYLAFRTAARAMAVEAENHREILIRHGWRRRCWRSSSSGWTSSTPRWRWAPRAGPLTWAQPRSSRRWRPGSCGRCG